MMHTLDLGLLMYAMPSSLDEIARDRHGPWGQYATTRQGRLTVAHQQYAAWGKKEKLKDHAIIFEKNLQNMDPLFETNLLSMSQFSISIEGHWAQSCPHVQTSVVVFLFHTNDKGSGKSQLVAAAH